MPPSETTHEEKGSRRYWRFVLVGAVVLVAAAFIFWPRADWRQHLSVTVLGYGTNSWGSPTVFAVVAVTNNTNETFILGTSGGSVSFPMNSFVLLRAESGWKISLSSHVWFELGTPPSKLLPGQGFAFEVGIPTDEPCKVAVDYLNDRLSGRIWQKLPTWLTKKLSWASPWRTATTEVIDLSKRQ